MERVDRSVVVVIVALVLGFELGSRVGVEFVRFGGFGGEGARHVDAGLPVGVILLVGAEEPIAPGEGRSVVAVEVHVVVIMELRSCDRKGELRKKITFSSRRAIFL